MARQFEITFEWGPSGARIGFEQQEYECSSYSVTAESNLLIMRDAILRGGAGHTGHHVVGVPLGDVRRYFIIDRHQRRVDP